MSFQNLTFFAQIHFSLYSLAVATYANLYPSIPMFSNSLLRICTSSAAGAAKAAAKQRANTTRNFIFSVLVELWCCLKESLKYCDDNATCGGLFYSESVKRFQGRLLNVCRKMNQRQSSIKYMTIVVHTTILRQLIATEVFLIFICVLHWYHMAGAWESFSATKAGLYGNCHGRAQALPSSTLGIAVLD